MSIQKRWSLFIDIEGFSTIFKVDPAKALWHLACLTKGIYLVAANLPQDEQQRLFVHQMGDGFVIVSNFAEPDLCRPVSIAISLMQYLLEFQCVARGGVSTGGSADIRGCLPKEIRDNLEGDGVYVSIPQGVMQIFPVMGDAFIRAYKTQANGTKGPLLFVDPPLRKLLAGMNLRLLRRSSSRVVVDWINSDTPLLPGLFETLGRRRPDLPELKRAMQRYIDSNHLNDRWRENALKMIQEPTEGARRLRARADGAPV